jgi:hypothetical protein
MLGWTAVVAGLIDIFGKLDAEIFLQGGRGGVFGRGMVFELRTI